MYPIQTGQVFMVQQSVTGTGVFDGTEFGRAKGQSPLSVGDPNAVVRISARLYGDAVNAYDLNLIDVGAGNGQGVTAVSVVGTDINVLLRRDSTLGLLATASEVASAINAANIAIRATYGGTGNGVVAADSIPIDNVESGVNSANRGPNNEQFLWFLPVNNDGGFFYFEQEETIVIRQFESKFTISSGTYSVIVSRVNLNDNLEPISTESIPVFQWDNLTSTKPDISFSDVSILLEPQQALTVTTSAGGLPGVVRFDVRKGARYPYL